jgi:hypothetical protein
LFDVNDHHAMDLDFLLRAVQAAHVKYFDENWGNFRLITGTKTHQDQQSTTNIKRYKKVIDAYMKDLPWLLRKLFFLYKSAQALDLVMHYLKKRMLSYSRSTG